MGNLSKFLLDSLIGQVSDRSCSCNFILAVVMESFSSYIKFKGIVQQKKKLIPKMHDFTYV